MSLKAGMILEVVFEGANLTEEVLELFRINDFPPIAKKLTTLRVEVRPEFYSRRCGDLALQLFPVSGPTDVDLNELPFAPECKPRLGMRIVE